MEGLDVVLRRADVIIDAYVLEVEDNTLPTLPTLQNDICFPKVNADLDRYLGRWDSA